MKDNDGSTSYEADKGNEVLKKLRQMASVKDTLRFIFDCGSGTKWMFCLGSIAAFLHGASVPLLCVIMYYGVQSGASFNITDEAYLEIAQVCTFLCFAGIYVCITSFIQSLCFEIVGRRATKQLGEQWFHALLRQDSAFFDVNDIAGIANSVHPNCLKYQNGMGRKLGEGIQNLVSVCGGGIFALGACWQVALLILAICPVLLILSVLAIKNNQQKSLRSSVAYIKAGGIAYTTVSSIKTVFACNAAQTMIQRYEEATQEAYKESTRSFFKIGLTNGSYVCLILGVFAVIPVFGSHIISNEIERNGCDPSGGIETNESCTITGVRIAGCTFGFLFALDALLAILNLLMGFIDARVVVHDALYAINRKVGTPKEIIYKEERSIEALVNDIEENTSTNMKQLISEEGSNNTTVSSEGFEDDDASLLSKPSIGSHSQYVDEQDKSHQQSRQETSLSYELIPATKKIATLVEAVDHGYEIVRKLSNLKTCTFESNHDAARKNTNARKSQEIEDDRSCEDGSIGKDINSMVDEVLGYKEEKSSILGKGSMMMMTGNAKVGNNQEDNYYGSHQNIKAILPKLEIDSFSNEGLKPNNIQGRISFKNINFSYPTRPGKPVLENFSIEIEAGKTVAFVGPSGGGKSTVVSMIERFYDPISGDVELDGINLREINVPHLRSIIGYVGQEPTLFATSIRNNIAFGCPGATQGKITAAAKMASAHDFITDFPDGYDTHVGEKGSRLSGGQKQRIAIARVLVGNPKILLLDEATSALDSESELVVQNAIDDILAKSDMTTCIIAHRLSTIRKADMIAVVADHRIVEKGTHSELMLKPNGYYRTLVKEQEGTKTGEEKEESEISARIETDNSFLDDDTTQQQQEENDEEESKLPRDEQKIPHSSSTAIINPLGSKDTPHINFRNVYFAYPTRTAKNIFNGLNLSIYRGETVALVGPSGGGKSTVVSLIERFYDPNEGVVEYMGSDIKTLNVHWYRDEIGYVSQEPTLLPGTIGSNIACGDENKISQQMVEEAAKQANAHNFILSFPDGYETPVGSSGSQLSGGQKQRIAIARALVKKPKVLLLDESTSALDSESEALVQGALEKLVATKEHTIILIAHRLSTVKNADRIAFISDGKVQEIGSHAELMNLGARYSRLVHAQKRDCTLQSIGLSEIEKSGKKGQEDVGKEDKDDDSVDKNIGSGNISLSKEDTRKYFNSKRAIKTVSPEFCFLFAGVLGVSLLGFMYTGWGITFAETINLLFHTVLECPNDDEIPEPGFSTCEEYWSASAHNLRQSSHIVSMYWGFVIVACMIGMLLNKWGFGMASERLIKRVRNGSFESLLRQEISFFDVNKIGTIMSVLQEDTMMIYYFSGEPLYSFIFGSASITTGVIFSFAFAWPVAIICILAIPFLGLSMLFKAKRSGGMDQRLLKNDSGNERSPGGIISETLLNIRTVWALAIESQRFESYRDSTRESHSRIMKDAVLSSIPESFACAAMFWIFACEIWFGTWIVYRYPDMFSMANVLRAVFAIYFSLFGLGVAFRESHDKDLLKRAVGRVFFLQDRKSPIDALGTAGGMIT